jgi:hypothetical protein
MTTYEITSLILGGGTAAILIVQLGIIIIALNADHGRRKKQSTLETAAKMLREARHVLQQEFSLLEITEKDMERLKEDKNLMAKINNAFGVFEHISLGVKAGVYDKDLLFRMFGGTFVEINNQYRLYIDYRRKNHGKFTYIELENIAMDYEKEQKLGKRDYGIIRLWPKW